MLYSKAQKESYKMITCLQKLIRYLYSLYFCFAYLNTLLTIGTFNFVMTGYHVSFCTCIFSNDLLKSFLNYREFTSIALYYGSICIHFAVYQMLFICMNSVFNCLCTALCKLCLWIKAKLYSICTFAICNCLPFYISLSSTN